MSKWIKVIIIIILSLFAGAAGAFLRLQPYIFPDDVAVRERISFDESSGTINILLVGLDSTDGSERSDSLAVAVIDIDSKNIKVLSIPRDSRVYIPGRGWDKINHAYVYGGINLLKDVVVRLLGISLNYYVALDFKTFPAIVDLIGGVTIDVEKRLVYNDYAGKLFINIPKGVQNLDGKNALHYVRFRHDSLSDLGRIARQQKFVKEIVRKLQSPSILPKLRDLTIEAARMINTDMSLDQAVMLASYLMDYNDLKFFMTPGKAGYIGAVSYWLPDMSAASMLLADNPMSEDILIDAFELNEDLPLILSKISGKISILNGEGSQGLGKRASDQLQNIGIDVGLTGNARHFDYRASCILIPTKGNNDDMESAEALAALCGINKRLISKSSTVSSVTIIFGKDSERIFTNLNTAKTKV